MSNTYSAGIVTAYGAAVRGGYTGTYAEFCAEQAGFAENAQSVAQDKADVESEVNTFINTTVPAKVAEVTAEGTTQIGLVTAEGTRQIGLVAAAGTEQIGLVEAEGTEQIGLVENEGARQAGLVEDKGEETLASIPDDYTTLSNTVSDLSSQFLQERDEGTQTFWGLGNFQHYGLKTDGTFQTSQPYRVSCDNSQLITFDRDVTISVATGFRWGYIPFENNTAGAWVGWKTTDFTMPSGTSFVVQIARTAENTSETANVSEFLSALTFNTYLSDEVTKLNTVAETATKNLSPNASLTSTGGGNINASCGTLGHVTTGKNYTLSFWNQTPQTSDVKLRIIEDGTTTQTEITNKNLIANGKFTLTFKATLTGDVVINTSLGSSLASTVVFTEIQLEENEIATYYVPYNSGTAKDVIARYTTEEIEKKIRSQYLTVPWITDQHQGFSTSTIYANTLPAYYRAFLNGVDSIETDARLTSDGIYVISHNDTVTVNGTTYTIANETAATLTALVLSTDSTYGECKIPTLESVLKLCLHTGMLCNIDCKSINASTLAQLVVDCGMSGKAVYANTSTANAATILTIDPNAGFLFSYSSSNLSSWATALTDYHTRQRSYAWANTISNEALEATRAYGFKYFLANVSTTDLMSYAPDGIEFISTADGKALNETYLASLNLL